MDADEAIRVTDEFKEAVRLLVMMELHEGGAFTAERIRLQRVRVAELEASLRTALLHSN